MAKINEIYRTAYFQTGCQFDRESQHIIHSKVVRQRQVLQSI